MVVLGRNGDVDGSVVEVVAHNAVKRRGPLFSFLEAFICGLVHVDLARAIFWVQGVTCERKGEERESVYVARLCREPGTFMNFTMSSP